MSTKASELIESTLNEIRAFEQAIDERIAQSHGELKKGITTLRKIWALRSISARLLRVRELLQIERYDLAFIGKVGAGKTTAICHLLNLLIEENTVINVDDENFEISTIKEILSTGAGRTTICEVVVRTNSTSFLEIDPYSDQEVRESIEIFCVYIWKRAHPTSLEAPDLTDISDKTELAKSDALPAELKRAVRNLVGLKESHRRGVHTDEATELAKQYRNYKDFKDEVVSRAKLSNRSTTRIESDSSSRDSAITQKKWIEKKFKEINLCTLSDVSIPRRIYVYLSPEILDLKRYSFRSIIDTRGIDEGKDREDLSRYIRDNDETICVFTEKFSDVPTNVIGLIEKYLTPESKDIDTKLVILTMPRQGEPRRIVSHDGPVNSSEESLLVRKSQIRDSFEGQNINFIDENILFYDALQFYDNEERTLKPHYSQSHVDKDKKRVLNELSGVVSRRRSKLIQEAYSLSELAYKIKDGELSPEDESRIEALKKTIEQCQQKNFSFNFEEDYIQSLKSYHVMVFRALNNRFGIYEYRGVNIYFDARSLTEDIVRRRLGDSKSEIVGAIKNTEEGSSEASGLKPVLEVLREQIDEYYEKLLIHAGEEIHDLLKHEKLAPLNESNPFWECIQLRWGQGKGYRNDVLQMYRDYLEAVDEFLRTTSQQLWHQEFMTKILEFFADEQ